MGRRAKNKQAPPQPLVGLGDTIKTSSRRATKRKQGVLEDTETNVNRPAKKSKQDQSHNKKPLNAAHSPEGTTKKAIKKDQTESEDESDSELYQDASENDSASKTLDASKKYVRCVVVTTTD